MTAILGDVMRKRGEEMQSEVFDALRRADAPMSAYDILAALSANNPKIAPTTVYRTLNALIKKGRIHRLESLNAYMACQCDAHDHQSILSICDDCGSVEETVAPELLARMSTVVGQSGFAPSRHVIEVHGTCADCGPERPAS
ncbi:MAG: Fur family transcriptional regulator [Pseudomonadota bacterium]